MLATTTTTEQAYDDVCDVHVFGKNGCDTLISVSQISARQVQKALTVPQAFQYEIRHDFPIPEIIEDDEIMIRGRAVGLNPIDFMTVDHNFCLPSFPWVCSMLFYNWCLR